MPLRRSAATSVSMKKNEKINNLQALAEQSAEMKNLLARITAVAAQINLNGWAEANAGNISVDVSSLLASKHGATKDWYLVSRSGSRYRDLAVDPLSVLLLISPSESTLGDGSPSSEWGCHLKLQQAARSRACGSKVVLHAHPDEIILLSQLDLFQNQESLNRALQEALPEMSIFFPGGVQPVKSAPPGSGELAELSFQALGDHNVLIWQGHGILALGRDPDHALDQIEVVAKAARLLLGRFFLTNMAK